MPQAALPRAPSEAARTAEPLPLLSVIKHYIHVRHPPAGHGPGSPEHEIPTGRKPYLASVQQIIWDRTSLCHHCILRTQDNAKLTERFSINFSTDCPWRPHSRVLKLFICSIGITAANPYWRSILTQRLCSTLY